MDNRYLQIVDELIDGVRGLTPSLMDGDPFNCDRDSHGTVEATNDWILNPDRNTRDFDIVWENSYPGPGCNFITEANIRIVYRMDIDNALMLGMIQGDQKLIYNDVVGCPSSWVSANSVHMNTTGLDTEYIEYEDGTPATVIVSIPIVIDYRANEVEESIAYTPEIVSCEQIDEGGVRIRVCAQARNAKTNSKATEPVTISVEYWDQLWASVEPSFYADPELYQTTIKSGTVDVMDTITTNDDGYVCFELCYVGINTDLTQRIRVKDSTGTYKDDCTIDIEQVRYFLNSTTGIDDPSSGTEAQPFATWDYAFGIVNSLVISTDVEPSAANLTLCISGAGTYTVNSRTPAFNIAGVVDGVILEGTSSTTIYVQNQYTYSLSWRNFRLLGDNPVTYNLRYSGYTHIYGLILDCSPEQASYNIFRNTSISATSALWATGCTLIGQSTYFAPIDSPMSFIHCELEGEEIAAGDFRPNVSFVASSTNIRNQSITLYDCIIKIGSNEVFLQTGSSPLRAATFQDRIKTDRNQYIEVTEPDYFLYNGKDGTYTYTTFDEWVAATGNDQNSTYTTV